MRHSFCFARRIAIVGAVVFSCSLLVGCAQQEPPPSAPGYYSGPMKPKGAGFAAPAGQNAKGSAKAGSV